MPATDSPGQAVTHLAPVVLAPAGLCQPPAELPHRIRLPEKTAYPVAGAGKNNQLDPEQHVPEVVVGLR